MATAIGIGRDGARGGAADPGGLVRRAVPVRPDRDARRGRRRRDRPARAGAASARRPGSTSCRCFCLRPRREPTKRRSTAACWHQASGSSRIPPPAAPVVRSARTCSTTASSTRSGRTDPQPAGRRDGTPEQDSHRHRGSARSHHARESRRPLRSGWPRELISSDAAGRAE